jgi:molecular chaperone DnaK (HSP70)
MSPEQKTESFFNLVEHVTTNNKSIKLSETVRVLPNDEDLRILTYKTLLEKFNQKYSKLNLSQKNLLRAYINNVSNTSSLKKVYTKTSSSDKTRIKKILKKFNR